jgi:hypothetical protein
MMMQNVLSNDRVKVLFPPAYLQAFVYLQLLDFLSTMIGLRLGLGEASPTIRPLIEPLGVGLAVGVSKLIAFSLAGVCLMTGRDRIIRMINYWFAALVVWNMMLIIIVLTRGN